MDGVVQRAAAALLLPGAAPPQVVVAVATPPEAVDLDVTHGPGDAAVQEGLQVPDGFSEAVLGDDGEQLPALVPRPEHGVALLEGRRHGLFADHILAALQRVDADGGVNVGRGTHVHQVDVSAGQNIFMVLVGIAGQAEFLHKAGGLAGNDVRQCDNLAAIP